MAGQRSYAGGKILAADNGDVTVLTINRPEVRNALDRGAALALRAAIADFEADPGQSVAVLHGAGGAFCAGADLKEISEEADYVAWAGDPRGPTHRACEKPVIAAIEGHACAGGLGLALWCDLRIGDDTAVFGVFSRRWGVPMSDGTTVRLPRLVGQGRALEMLLTGRPVHAQEALSWGLLNDCVPRGEALAAAKSLAARMAGFPQVALRSDRRSAYAQNGLEMAEAIALEMQIAAEAKRLEATDGARRFADGAGRHGAQDA